MNSGKLSFLVRFLLIEKCTFREFTCSLSFFDHKDILKVLPFSYLPHDKKNYIELKKITHITKV